MDPWRLVGMSALALSLLGQATTPADAQEPERVSACYQGQTVVGIALPDTVPVDSGVAFRVLPRDSVSGVYGQKFLLERARPEVTGDTIVLVRWQPPVDSPPYKPRSSAQWILPGDKQLVHAALRTPAHWTGGLPTFDVRGPYFPRDLSSAEQRAQRRGELMTADELFDFCALEVDLDVVRRGDWSTDIEPMTWARRSRGDWRKYPAPRYLYSWAQEIERHRVADLPVDVAGTWALTATLPSGRVVELFFRTSDRTGGYWGRRLSVDERPEQVPWTYRAEGYRVDMWMARHLEDLPTIQGGASVLSCRGFVVMLGPGRVARPTNPSCFRASWAWEVGFAVDSKAPRTGYWEARSLRDVFDEDQVLADLFPPWISSEAGEAKAQNPTDGKFLDLRTGLEYHQDVATRGGGVLRLVAVRISPETVHDVRDRRMRPAT
jgi:hypothetical protein